MSQPALIEIDNAAEEAAGLAYERCETYAWQGQNINWSRGHNWLWLSIIRKADFEIEQDALAVVWVGRMDADEIKKCRRELRKDPTAVIEEVDEFINRYDVQGPELGDAIEIANQIFIDRNASANDIKAEPGEEGATDAPKKSARMPGIFTTSTEQQD
tara:strand:- start:6607 stop:7080 length:474 start_codon:yes stop_codon:yes gene_type:complete